MSSTAASSQAAARPGAGRIGRARAQLAERFGRAERWGSVALASSVGLTLCAGLALADGAVLARVGAIAIDADTFRERTSRVAELDWPTLGASWPERRRRFLEEILIAEALLALGAEGGTETPGPASAPAAQRPAPSLPRSSLPRASLPSARDAALARALRVEIGAQSSRAAPSDADIAAYYERHRREYVTPRALTLWRILLPTDAEARAVLAELAAPTPTLFSRIARDRSMDTATRMRAGNLGRVSADGQTHMPELHVAPALYAAADRVEDGQLVPDPVPEGQGFAVVWRRASHPAGGVPLASATPAISERLAEERAAAARQELIGRLRREHLGEYHPERAAAYEPHFAEPSRPQRRHPPAAATQTPRLRPVPTDRGLR